MTPEGLTLLPYNTTSPTMTTAAKEPDPPAWRVETGHRLRRLRLERGLTLRALAADARMYWIELDRYERAMQEPNLERLYALADILDTDLHSILPPTRAED